nr:3-phosphoshikimate 1-carboxyvinyltransferase [Ostreibacterium oceani]
MSSWQTNPSQQISGDIRVPGDKSISHRSIMLGALAKGVTEIRGFLSGDDCVATRQAFEAMGVNITDQDDVICIEGVGINGLQAPAKPIDVGNSGTGMRLLAGVLAGQSFASTLVGDASLMQRPMKRVAEPLKQMGANVSVNAAGCAPIAIAPSSGLHGVTYHQSVASAQVKSALLLAGIYAEGETIVHEPGVSRDHTERMLRSFGYPVETIVTGESRTTKLQGGGVLNATQITIPGDISSAAFFMVVAAIAPAGSVLTIRGVGVNPTRTGIIDILQQMGADLTLENQRKVGDEPIADVVVRASTLKGITVPRELVPLAIDEFPVIFVAAACATGTFILRDAKELRVKESDRIAAMATGLAALGVKCEVLEDGMVIHGNSDNPFPNAATIDSLTDHRIAMAFAVAGTRACQAITILQCAHVATSFPNFRALAAAVGMSVEETNDLAGTSDG